MLKFWARDTECAYYGFNRIVDVDVDSFEVLGVNYAKDQNSVWVAITKKHNAAELRQLSESDRNRAGAGGWLLVVVRLENVDASTFQVSRVKQYFAIDDKGCFRLEKRVPCSDLE